MLNDKRIVLVFLQKTIDDFWKILPLYEEKNEFLKINIESLIFKLRGSEKVINIDYGYEYTSLLSILVSLKEEIEKDGDRKKIIKREVFKCTKIIDKMIAKLEKGDES